MSKKTGEGHSDGRERGFGEIYALILPNGKRYVGLATKGAAHRWSRHVYESQREKPSLLISRAIAKYGPQNIRLRVLARTRDFEALKRLEQFYIADYGTTDRNRGYNLTIGGDGTPGRIATQETLQRMRAANLGKTISAEQRAKISAKLTGQKLSPETRAKIGAAHKGRVFSEESLDKMRQSQRERYARKPVSAETCERNRQSKIKWYAEHPEARERLRTQNLGKKRSAEHRAKIAAGHKGRKCSAEASEHMRLAWNNRKVRKEGTSQETRDKIRQTLLARYEQHPEMKEHLRQKSLGRPKSPETIEKQRQAIIATLQKKRQQKYQGDLPCPVTK